MMYLELVLYKVKAKGYSKIKDGFKNFGCIHLSIFPNGTVLDDSAKTKKTEEE